MGLPPILGVYDWGTPAVVRSMGMSVHWTMPAFVSKDCVPAMRLLMDVSPVEKLVTSAPLLTFNPPAKVEVALALSALKF